MIFNKKEALLRKRETIRKCTIAFTLRELEKIPPPVCPPNGAIIDVDYTDKWPCTALRSLRS